MGNESEVKIKMGITGTEDVLNKVAKVEQGFKQQQKALIALGTGFGIATLISKFSDSLSEAIQRSNQLGIISQKNTEIFSRYKQATRDLEQAKSRLAAEITSVLAPSLTTAANAASGMVSGMANITANSNAARSSILGVAAAATTLAVAVSGSKVAGLLGLAGTAKFLGRAGLAGAVGVGSYQAGKAAGELSYGGVAFGDRLAAGFLDAQMRWEQLQNKLFGANNLEKIQALREEMQKLLYPTPEDTSRPVGGLIDRDDLERKRQALQLQIDENNQISEGNQLQLNGDELQAAKDKQLEFNEQKIGEMRILNQQAFNARILTATEYKEIELRDTGSLLNLDKERLKTAVALDQRELARLTLQRQNKAGTENFLSGLIDSDPLLSDSDRQARKLQFLNATIEQTTRELKEYDAQIEKMNPQGQDQIDIAQKGRELYENRLTDLGQQRTQTSQVLSPDDTRGQAIRAINDVQDAYGHMAKNIGDAFRSSIGGAINAISSGITGLIMGTQTWGEALRNIGVNIVQSIVQAFADMAAKWIATHVIMEGAAWAFSQAMIAIKWLTTGEEISAEVSKTPVLATNAALSSAGSYGTSAIIGIAALIAAVGVGIAAVSGAFKEGGYTGSMGVNDVAGVVHGQEFVMPADAVKRIGVGNLEAMKSGAQTDSLLQSGGGANVTVVMFDDRAKMNEFLHSPAGRDAIVKTVGENRHKIS